MTDSVSNSKGLGEILARLRERGDFQDSGVEFHGRSKDKNP
jgi:hypothetical protein